MIHGAFIWISLLFLLFLKLYITLFMKKIPVFLIALAAGLIAGCALAFLPCNHGPQFDWTTVVMDGSRTGAVPVNAENVDTALGSFDGETYKAPSGRTWTSGPVPEVAAMLLDAQPGMARLKQVVGHSAKMMMNVRTEPETPLSNLVVDAFRERGTKEFKKPMDFAITNFGGIRIPMPEGAITLEDVESMFPFKNYLAFARVKGENLLKLFDQLALTKSFQAISGAKVTVRGQKVTEALVGGKPVDPARVYNVTTIDFLLDGGDGISIGALAEEVKLTHLLLKDVMLDYIRAKEAAGEMVDGNLDGRVTMLEE